MKKTFCATVALLLSMTAIEANEKSSVSAEALRADYAEAVKAFARDYVYLEEKTGMSRAAFIEESMKSAPGIRDAAGFVDAMWRFRSMVPDGHFGWSIDPDLSPMGESRRLPFVATVKDGFVSISSVEAGSQAETAGLVPGAILTSWNGAPVRAELERLCALMPQSTKRATEEWCVRFLAFNPAWAPLPTPNAPVEIGFRDASGATKKLTLDWMEGRPFITRNGIPSTEDIPSDAVRLHASIYLYRREVSGKKVAFAHFRDFSTWGLAELRLLGVMLSKDKPDLLLIDLKDSAGGAFDQVMYLSAFLGIRKPFAFTQKTYDSAAGRHVEEEADFGWLLERAEGLPAWDGPTALRTNPVCGSGCDYFAYWFKKNSRGVVVGEETAGRGAGTDTLSLEATGVEVDIPARDRRMSGETHSIEGHPVQPDVFHEGTPEECAGAVLGVGAKAQK